MSEVILVTGAAGYIGSHFIEAFIEDDFWLARAPRLVFLDDLSTGHLEFIHRLTLLAKERGLPVPVFESVSLLDSVALDRVLDQHRPTAVLHYAARISVAESVANPALYLSNNVEGSCNLLSSMKKSGTRNLIFSSTAAVYGAVADPKLRDLPLPESTPLGPINPYGETKLQMEEEIRKAALDWGLNSVIFRYFNAAGASLRGRLGEWHEPETHLIPLMLRALLSGKPLSVFGTDYPTRDGSCVRDYIHVSDLASAHRMGLLRLLSNAVQGSEVYNLGTASGTSVLEVIKAAEKVTGKKVAYEVFPRRPGDSGVLIADATRARTVLGWVPNSSSVEAIIQTALQWEQGGLKSMNHQ